MDATTGRNQNHKFVIKSEDSDKMNKEDKSDTSKSSSLPTFEKLAKTILSIGSNHLYELSKGDDHIHSNSLTEEISSKDQHSPNDLPPESDENIATKPKKNKGDKVKCENAKEKIRHFLEGEYFQKSFKQNLTEVDQSGIRMPKFF